MKIGFTGTSIGMTREQKRELFKMLSPFPYAEYHHGDCIGADEEFHALVKNIQHQTIGSIIIHPPLNLRKRAFCEGGTVRSKKSYLIRNRDIVDETDLLIVCPHEDVEQLRSGTWSTFRYAIKKMKDVTIIFPNGGIKNYE